LVACGESGEGLGFVALGDAELGIAAAVGVLQADDLAEEDDGAVEVVAGPGDFVLLEDGFIDEDALGGPSGSSGTRCGMTKAVVANFAIYDLFRREGRQRLLGLNSSLFSGQ